MATRESVYEVCIGVTVLKDVGKGVWQKTAFFGDGAQYGGMNMGDVTAMENWFVASGAKNKLSEGLDPVLQMLAQLGLQQLAASGEFSDELKRVEEGLAALGATPPDLS